MLWPSTLVQCEAIYSGRNGLHVFTLNRSAADLLGPIEMSTNWKWLLVARNWRASSRKNKLFPVLQYFRFHNGRQLR